MRKLLLAASILGSVMMNNVSAQTLAIGDIAFTGYNSDGTDDFCFMVLRTGGITAGTQIRFTNWAWSSGSCGTNGWGTTTEEEILWTASSNLAYGSQVRINGLTASSGTVSGTPLNQSSVGDQIFAFQGVRTGSHTLIAGIHMNYEPGVTSANNWDAVGTPTGTQSNRPACLTNGTYALYVTATSGTDEVDNARLKTSFVISGNSATDRAFINNRSNWDVDDATPFTLPATFIFLPVKFTYFGVRGIDSNIEVAWDIAEEDNIERYVVERSFNGTTFSDVAFFPATGATTYKWLTSGAPSIVYYRVRAEEIGGKFIYTSIIRFKPVNGKPSIYVNVSGNSLQLSKVRLPEGAYKVELYSLQGALLHQSQLIVSGVPQFYTVDLKRKPSAGIYFIRLQSSSFNSSTRFLLE